jgi:hypothetical protein
MKMITTAKEYFNEVVGYNLEAYKAKPTSLPAAYNLANTLFSMHEWMWSTYGTALGADCQKVKDYKAHVLADCTGFKHMRDLANASKHVSLSSASTQATQITDTAAIESNVGEAIIGVSKIERGVVVINDGGTNVDFENTADEVHAYWNNVLVNLS